MKATELIKALENVVARHGDIEVICKMWETGLADEIMYENNKDINGLIIEELEKDYVFVGSDGSCKSLDPQLYLVLECNDPINTKVHDIEEFSQDWDGEEW